MRQHGRHEPHVAVGGCNVELRKDRMSQGRVGRESVVLPELVASLYTALLAKGIIQPKVR